MVIGGFSVIFAAIAQNIFGEILNLRNDQLTFAYLFAYHSFFVGVIEELVKFMVVLLFAYHTIDFDEPVDGLVYSAAAAIGFATFENALYAVSYGFGVFILRVWLTILGHIMFSAIWGYELGRYRFESKKHHLPQLLISILFAAIAHGLYNSLVSHSNKIMLPLAVIFITIIMWRIVKNMYRMAMMRSITLNDKRR